MNSWRANLCLCFCAAPFHHKDIQDRGGRLCTHHPFTLPCIKLAGRFALMQGHHGEITEQSGRLCVAVPASPDGPPKGILLGSGPGGSTW